MNWYEEGYEGEKEDAKGDGSIEDSETHIRFIFANILYLSH